MLFGVPNSQCLTAWPANSEKFLSNSWVESECSQGTHHKQNTRAVCISKPSEFSRDSLGGVGSNVSVPKFSWFKSMSQIVGLTAAWQQNKVEGNPMGEQILQVMLKQTPTQCTQSSTSFYETIMSQLNSLSR